MKKESIFTFKISADFLEHLKQTAEKKGLKKSEYARLVLKKHSKYKEPKIEI